MVTVFSDAEVASIGLPSSFIELESPIGTREIAGGDLSFGRWVAEELHITTFDQELDYEGGRVLVGGAVSTLFGAAKWLQLIGIWEGGAHSLKSTQVGGKQETLIGLFELLNIAEESSGIALQPRSKDLRVLTEGLHGPQVAVPIRDLGILHVRRLTEELRSSLPDWSGLEVRGGQLFLEEGERASTLILVGESTYSKFYSADSAGSEQVRAFVDSLVVDWDDADSFLSA
jgi:hypothetical protein